MRKKPFIAILAAIISIALSFSTEGVVLAQSAKEIISRMEAELGKHDDSEGVIMTMDFKMPVLGTMSSRIYSLGKKTRMEATSKGVLAITWMDGDTIWAYDEKTNTVTVKNANPSSDSKKDGNMDMFVGVTEGYDVSLKTEDAVNWYILCKKSRTNKEKDDPRKMDIVVRKSDYWPVSLSASMSGVKMTLRDIAFGVTEKQVTFDISDYPGAEIVDNRNRGTASQSSPMAG